MRKLITMLLCMVFAVGQLAAQTRTIKGKVTDEKGAAVAGSSILVKGTTVGATSDLDGTFSINAPSSATALVIKAIGFAEQEIAITRNNNYTVSLKTVAANLEE